MSQQPTAVVAHIGICVSDIERSAAFYMKALGFTYERDIGELGPPFDTLIELPAAKLQAYQLKCGEVKIELISYPNVEITGSSERCPMNRRGFTHMTLVVADINATAARIVEHGGSAHAETRIDSPYGPIMFCSDPNGLRIEIMEYKG